MVVLLAPLAPPPQVGVNPADGMSATVESIAAAVTACRQRSDAPVVVGVPCNTFHAPTIWSSFEAKISHLPACQPLHMLRETGDLIAATAPGAKRIGLMSTTGTRQVSVGARPSVCLGGQPATGGGRQRRCGAERARGARRRAGTQCTRPGERRPGAVPGGASDGAVGGRMRCA